MKIEEIKIEDAADANYVIRKFLNDQFKDLKMSQLEQLVLTVYNMGKNSGAGPSETLDAPDIEPESPAVPDNAVVLDSSIDDTPEVVSNPFKISDRAKAIEDIEIAHSGEIIKADTVGTINSVKEDIVSFLFESDETGEMIEASVEFDKLEKIS